MDTFLKNAPLPYFWLLKGQEIKNELLTLMCITSIYFKKYIIQYFTAGKILTSSFVWFIDQIVYFNNNKVQVQYKLIIKLKQINLTARSNQQLNCRIQRPFQMLDMCILFKCKLAVKYWILVSWTANTYFKTNLAPKSKPLYGCLRRQHTQSLSITILWCIEAILLWIGCFHSLA